MLTTSAEPPLPPLLRLPDESIEHIASFLPDLSMPLKEYDEDPEMSLQSLASTCRRLRAIVLPLSWKSITLTQCDKRLPCIRGRLGQYGRFVRSIRAEYVDDFIWFGPSEYNADQLVGAVVSWLPFCPGLIDFVFRVLTGERCHFKPLLAGLVNTAPRLERLQIEAAYWKLSTFQAFDRVLQSANLLETLSLKLDRSYKDETLASGILPLPSSLPHLRDLTVPRATCLRNWTADTAPVCRSLTFNFLGLDDWTCLQRCRGDSLTSLAFRDLSKADKPDQPFEFANLHHIRVESSLGWSILSSLLAPSTPIETLSFHRLDDTLMTDIQRFSARQPCKTLKRINFKAARQGEPGLDEYLIDRTLGDRDEVLERRLAAFIALDERRLREYSAWAVANGIEFSAPAWKDEALARAYSAA